MAAPANLRRLFHFPKLLPVCLFNLGTFYWLTLKSCWVASRMLGFSAFR